jgi:Ca-activated chloride channel family protein
MEKKTGLSYWLWLATTSAATACFVALSVRPVHAQDGAAPRATTESPYFFVKSDEPGVDALPLKSTDVQVNIAGVIADVVVTQVYRNEGTRAIEARYVFPGSSRAAVHGMQVRLADRLITARIREKQQARIEFDAARREGKTAALLEQHLPNVFQMNVANILPGDEVRVELRYTELLVPRAGQYQFVFPTVVGPRYAGGARGAVDAPVAAGAPTVPAAWPAQPFLRPGTPPAASFDLRVFLQSPLPLQSVSSSTHAIRVMREAEPGGATSGPTAANATTPAATEPPRRASVTLADDGQPRANRDFILDYRLAGDAVQSGLMLHAGTGTGGGGDENYFLAMVQPPKAVPARAVSPRDYIFVVDISGSMHGFPLDTAKAMLSELIGGLRPSDTFNVMLFSGSNRMLSPRSVPATRANIDQALRTIDHFQGSGGTELIPALERVYREPKPADVARTVVVVTDGYVTVDNEAFALVRQNLSKANVFAFGIGSAVNRNLMEGLARAGMGEPFIITRREDARAEAARFRQMIESPVLTGVTARFEGLDVYDVAPVQLPDVLAERPVILFGKWRGTPRGHLVVEGMSAHGPWRQRLDVDAARVGRGADTEALRYLWARHRIAELSDQEALDGRGLLRNDILALGLRHHLLTQYTSFLAVDQVVRNPRPQDTAGVSQPSPLPQGVGPLAVGGGDSVAGAEVPATPEPATWGAMLVTLSVLAMAVRRARRQRAHHFTA